MARTWKYFGASLISCLLGGCGTDAEQRSPADCNLDTPLPTQADVAPANILDLHHWSLTLPVDSSGGTTGTARTVSTADLLNGYHSEWFYGAENGGVAFWAPVNGALTPNARYARSDLRELVNPSDESVNWFTTEDAKLTASVAVNRIPAGSGKAIVGKIVGYNVNDPDTNFLVHLVFQVHANTCTASLYGLVEHSPSASTSETDHVTVVEDGLHLNEEFAYSIEVHAGMLTLASGSHSASVTIDSSWNSVPVYFRAGAGLNATGTDGADGVAVTVYQLDVTH